MTDMDDVFRDPPKKMSLTDAQFDRFLAQRKAEMNAKIGLRAFVSIIAVVAVITVTAILGASGLWS